MRENPASRSILYVRICGNTATLTLWKKGIYMNMPVFVSLTGTDTETDEFYNALEREIPIAFPDLKCVFLGDPLADYDEVRVGSKRKSEFVAPARVCLRWALFYQFNATVIKSAFEESADIVVVRRYGYDLYEGAVAFARDCPTSLSIHEKLVPFGVTELGLCPPLYLFTKLLDKESEARTRKYFSLPNQRRHVLQAATVRERFDHALDLINLELQVREELQAA